MNNPINLFEKHSAKINEAINAIKTRNFYAAYPESPRAYAEDADANGKTAFSKYMNNDFKELMQGDTEEWHGEEVSPYFQVGIGIKYPVYNADTLIANSKKAAHDWAKASPETRAGILAESLEKLKERFFEIAYATMHTTGQGFMMSFQASGPHANDRAMEAIAMGYEELTRFPKEVEWKKNMGKSDLVLKKSWIAIPKGIGLIIGCSTFPTWNSVPGLYADLVTGNTVIVKPHPKAVLPMAIVVAEIQKTLKENGFDPLICQLAADSSKQPLAKILAEEPLVKLIDFTGSTTMGKYVEGLGKLSFTENAGVNSVILHSVHNLQEVMQNIAFSCSLYSGQMCTAPQNIFIPKDGVKTDNGIASYEEVAKMFAESITAILNNPKSGHHTLGAIQGDVTMHRANNASTMGANVLLESTTVNNPEFPNARTATPSILEVSASQKDVYLQEMFGPVTVIIKTDSIDESIALAKEVASKAGSITCLAYTTDEEVQRKIANEMNEAYTPVSFNFTGAAFVNQHASFSDLHVTGGNPSGNASFTNPEFINKRFVWVGNRMM